METPYNLQKIRQKLDNTSKINEGINYPSATVVDRAVGTIASVYLTIDGYSVNRETVGSISAVLLDSAYRRLSELKLDSYSCII